MESIELKPKPISIIIKVFIIMFILFIYKTFLEGGVFEMSKVWFFLRARAIEAAIATATFSLALAIPYFRKQFNFYLTDATLRAPMKRKRLEVAKLITFDLSEILVKRSLRDRLIGTQVVTTDGEPLQIHSFFYGRKSISKFLDEIENRQREHERE